MKQKYQLGKDYWVFHNNQPIKAQLTNVRLNTSIRSFGDIILDKKDTIMYSFRSLREKLGENRFSLVEFKADKIFRTLTDLAKHYNLK